MRSASKSVVSLLVGIAIDRKLIASADEPVAKFFPQYAPLPAGWDAITLRHLLTMSSGIQWDETLPWSDPKNDEPHLVFDPDPLRYILSKPIVAPPDTLWVYNGGGTDLLGNLLERVSGKTLAGICRRSAVSAARHHRVRMERLSQERQDRRRGRASPAPARCRKIGQLVLNRGAWQGKQIVPADWIEQIDDAALPGRRLFRRHMFYGYQWWMGRSLSNGREVKWVAAFGWGGQRIFIVPELDLVMMTTAAQYGKPKEGLAAMDILANVVIAAVRDAR